MRYNALKSCATRVSSRGPSLALRAIHLVLRLRRPSDMCSRTVSDTANTRIHERTQCVSAEEKILCRSPYFAAVTCRQSAPDPLRERGNSQEGGNRRCLPSCAPARRQRTPLPRGAARSRRPQTANPPLDFKQKTPRPLGANTLTQFVSPAQPVLKKAAAKQKKRADV